MNLKDLKLGQFVVLSHRWKHIGTVKGKKNIIITHVEGNDTYMVEVYTDNSLKKLSHFTPYRSLVAAKKYVAKLLKKNYEDIELIMTKRKI